MYRCFAANRMKAHTEFAFPGRVHDEALVSDDTRNVEAVLEGAAAGTDLQARNRPALQDHFQTAEVSGSYVTAQFENNPRARPHAPYLKGTRRLDKRDQHEGARSA